MKFCLASRIMVKSVLFYVGRGKNWDWISEQYFGKISGEATNLTLTTRYRGGLHP